MEKKRFILTPETMKAANDYLPLSKMAMLAKTIAPACLEKSKTAKQNEKGLEFLALPTLWVDDPELKELYKMHVLLEYYLKIPTPDDFSDKEYDTFGEAHILNQIERFKGNAGLKDKVFDLLENYKRFEKMLNIEIENEKAVRNDPVARLTAAISIVSNPENIKKMKEELERTADEFQIKQHDAIQQVRGKVEEE